MSDLIRIVSHQILAVRDKGDLSVRADLDSHADTTCIGQHSAIIGTTYKTVRVTPFLKSFGTVSKVQMVNAALAYDDPQSGETKILIFYQVLHFKEMTNHLLSPMQMHMNELTVNETPKFLSEKPDRKTHAIIVDDLLVPLEINGVISYFPVREPTADELESCDRYEITAQEPALEPHSDRLGEEESLKSHYDGLINYGNDRKIFAIELDPTYSFDHQVSAVRASKSTSTIDPQVLAQY